MRLALASVYTRVSADEISRRQVIKSRAFLPTADGERKCSLCASTRMKRSTGPRSPVISPAHTSSSARYSRHPAPLTLSHGAESIWKARRVDGQAANGQVLAARAQNSSVRTTDRQQVQWHLQNQAVCGAAAPLVPPRCMHGAQPAHGCPRSAWSALRAASEDGTGGPLTKAIEYDVPSTRPGRGDARGARGGL